MPPRSSNRFRDALSSAEQLFKGPQSLAFLPAIALAAFWLGGELVLLGVALGLPLLVFLTGGFAARRKPAPPPQRQIEILSQDDAGNLAEQALLRAKAANLATACVLVEAEGLDQIARQHGERMAECARDALQTRLRGLSRKDDQCLRVGDSRFMVLLSPSLRLDLESLLQMCDRLQRGLEEPLTVNTATLYVSVSFGFCGSNRLKENASGPQLVEAAQAALTEALANGPSAVRAWTDSMRVARTARASLIGEVEKALVNGQIQPWFQPQICTSTGRITGVEALARWIHPDKGIVPPAQFLRVLEEAGQMDRLSEVILQHSLTALRSWDQSGIDVPRVSINCSNAELRNPRLTERIKWELDRFGLTSQRLGIEVLETVIADSPDGIIARNIGQLSELGCFVDLDDFGTGHASITALRRFTVHRLKIDRSFVTRIDRSEEQRRMLAAVLSLADRLELETLAEGVESVGEHALLAQLGCDHVQGFGIARPMPGDQLVEWSRDHDSRMAEARQISGKTR